VLREMLGIVLRHNAVTEGLRMGKTMKNKDWKVEGSSYRGVTGSGILSSVALQIFT